MTRVELGGDLMLAWSIEAFHLSMFRLAPDTAAHGQRAVELFAFFLNETKGICDPSVVTKQDVRAFIYDMSERGLAVSTRNHWVTDIRRYVNWCEKISGGGCP